MNDLWAAVAGLAAELHRDRVDAIAEAIANIDSQDDLMGIRHAFGPNANEDRIKALRSSWSAFPKISPSEIAAAFHAAARAAELVSSGDSVELVWSGPKTSLIPTRNTEQVILEVIDIAKSHLFLVSYVFYKATSIVDALNRATAKGVQVNLLLESSTEHGGTIRGDSVQTMAVSVPEATIYVWGSETKRPQGDALSAAVHAKCAVADGEVAFITSANLTSAAFERNMELGVLLRGGTSPQRLRSHLMALITTKQIERWKK
ncbi:DISARM system phospholipase D-like protein DrmC [Botrimarina sp.]|uniref:DISARM system phospholipase D-like protein DrmC n=1 Tax=Botrimarina sp. TaxID=2795802 RepID=UPI0032EEB57A